jgi:hypothetical protein
MQLRLQELTWTLPRFLLLSGRGAQAGEHPVEDLAEFRALGQRVVGARDRQAGLG